LKLAAHGIALELPEGWDGRIYRAHGSEPIVHAANFALPAKDGDFGSGATGRMLPGGVFVALKEYRPGPRLIAGEGLFASRSLPLPLVSRRFDPRTLQVTRPGQAGFQHFFTYAGRPFCLYAVVSSHLPEAMVGSHWPEATDAVITRDRLASLNRILSTLAIRRGR
jgi:hypothetical protein